MSTFSTYGHAFEVPNKFAEGHPLSANEAIALNGLMAEMISHRVRSGPLDACAKGDTPTPEQVAEAEKLIIETAAVFEFGAGRGPGAVQLNPIDREAKAIARSEVKSLIARKGLKLAKKGEAAGEGEYSFDAYESKVLEVMAMPQVQKVAKATVAARNKSSDDLGITI
jgi:hypothetical protein